MSIDPLLQRLETSFLIDYHSNVVTPINTYTKRNSEQLEFNELVWFTTRVLCLEILLVWFESISIIFENIIEAVNYKFQKNKQYGHLFCIRLIYNKLHKPQRIQQTFKINQLDRTTLIEYDVAQFDQLCWL